jgi:hypothetical protein
MPQIAPVLNQLQPPFSPVGNQRRWLPVLAVIIWIILSWGFIYPSAAGAAPQNPSAAMGTSITTSSGQSELALARHLTKVGAKMYGAYWCSHCSDQKQLFGKEAWPTINYIECAADGLKANPQACEQAKIEGFPTWLIQGRKYPGTMSMLQLSQLSGYQGATNFRKNLTR